MGESGMRRARELAVVVVRVQERRNRDLAEVAQAGGGAGRFFGPREGRQQPCREHADDRDDHQQLDQRKGARGVPGAHGVIGRTR
jgi:hypothetical protein